MKTSHEAVEPWSSRRKLAGDAFGIRWCVAMVHSRVRRVTTHGCRTTYVEKGSEVTKNGGEKRQGKLEKTQGKAFLKMHKRQAVKTQGKADKKLLIRSSRN